MRAEKIRPNWYNVFDSDKLDGLTHQAIQSSPALGADRTSPHPTERAHDKQVALVSVE